MDKEGKVRQSHESDGDFGKGGGARNSGCTLHESSNFSLLGIGFLFFSTPSLSDFAKVVVSC